MQPPHAQQPLDTLSQLRLGSVPQASGHAASKRVDGKRGVAKLAFDEGVEVMAAVAVPVAEALAAERRVPEHGSEAEVARHQRLKLLDR